jgi:hypothetical protein
MDVISSIKKKKKNLNSNITHKEIYVCLQPDWSGSNRNLLFKESIDNENKKKKQEKRRTVSLSLTFLNCEILYFLSRSEIGDPKKTLPIN